jgi:hypothetical protein
MKDAETLMTYEQATDLAISTPNVKASDLEHRRHYVGFWCLEPRMAVGSDTSMYDLHKAASEPVNDWTLSLATLSFNGGKWFTAGAAVNVLKKDVSPAHVNAAAHAYDLQLKQAGKISVLFYSSDDRRAWLVDGASALVHLARAFLVSDMAEHKSLDAIGKLPCIRGDGGVTAAIRVLRDPDNRCLPIFEEAHNTVERTISRTFTSASPSSPECTEKAPHESKVFSTKGSVWTYENLVVNLWEHLQEMRSILYRLQRRSSPEMDLRMLETRLLGWNAKDVISSSDPMEPRHVELRSDGKSWLPFARELLSVVLMARNFGNLITPSPGPQLCKNMTELPQGRDLLAIPQ